MARASRTFRWALLASLLLHISALTIFKIVIYFPRQDIVYADFAVVAEGGPTSPAENTVASTNPQLRLRGPDLDRALGTAPPVELTTLEFGELSRLQLRQEALADERLYESIAGGGVDSWKRFGAGLREITEALDSLGESRSEVPSLAPPPEAISLSLSEDFEARLTWQAPPFDRPAIFVPPLEALWSLAPAAFSSILLVLEVDASGRVVNVYSQSEADRSLLDALQAAALKLRFERIAESGLLTRQPATLRIAPADAPQ